MPFLTYFDFICTFSIIITIPKNDCVHNKKKYIYVFIYFFIALQCQTNKFLIFSDSKTSLTFSGCAVNHLI